MAGAEIERGFEQRAVHTVQGRIKRQDHEGQVDEDETENDGEIVVQQGHRVEFTERAASHLVGDVEQPVIGHVDISLGAQDRDQGIGAHQEIGPKRQHDEHQQPAFGFFRCKGNGHGDREADDQAQEGGDHCDDDRFPEDAKIEGIEGVGVVGPRAGESDVDQAAVLTEAI